jgi:hypothetical protein
MAVVGAGFEDGIGDGAGGASQLGFEVTGADVHGLQRFERGDVDLEQAGALIVVDTIELEIVGDARLSVDLRREAVLRVEELGMRPGRRGWRRARD